jgi:hypothetical protein
MTQKVISLVYFYLIQSFFIYSIGVMVYVFDTVFDRQKSGSLQVTSETRHEGRFVCRHLI